MPATPSIGKHLASFNLFREADNSIHVTISDARGVRDELGGSNAPLYLCAMNALRSAVELRVPDEAKRNAASDLYEACVWAEAALAPFSKNPVEKSGISKLRAAIAKARGD